MGVNCPYCGAPAQVDVCEYCGSALENDRASQTIIVNHYYGDSGSSGESSTAAHAAFYVNERHGMEVSPKSRTITLVLALFLGYFGVHRFYAGRIAFGLVYFFTLGLFGIGWMVDIILAAIGRLKDSQGRIISQW